MKLFCNHCQESEEVYVEQASLKAMLLQKEEDQYDYNKNQNHQGGKLNEKESKESNQG